MELLQKNKGFFLTKQELHTAVLNPQGSKTFLKKIIPISLSFILYQRIQLDEKDFQTRSYGGNKYKVFKPKLQNSNLQKVRDWVAAALQALEKNYLRELYLILGSAKDPNIIFESYKFQFKYMGDDVIHLDLPATENELKQSTDSLLKAIDSLKEHPKYIEGELDLEMAITYYEEVTPVDYNPPFFKNDKEDSEAILQSLQKQPRDYLHLGLLKTGYHTVKCRAKGEVFSLNRTLSSSALIIDNQEENDKLVETEEADDSSNKPYHGAELGNTQESEVQNNQETEPQSMTQVSQEAELDDRHDTQSLTISELSDRLVETLEVVEIKCTCKISYDFELIHQIKCSQCLTFQHCVCLGYLSQSDIPIPYICPECNDIGDWSLSKEERRKLISIYRLAVGVAYFTELFPYKVMEKLTKEVKDIMVKKMKDCKILKKKNDGEYEVNMELLSNSFIKGIFSKSFQKRTLEKSNEEEQTSLKKGKYV